jgi:outer membrane protein assembly factor BamB
MKRIAYTVAVCFAAAGIGWWATRPTVLPTPEVLWVREFRKRGAVMAAPALDETRLYVAVVCDRGLDPGGAVHALDRATGKTVWTFDDDGAMARSACPPRVAGGRVYVGEGLHEAREAKFYCLDAGTRRKLWEFAAAGHIEGGALVENGRVVFGAGDAGAYALNVDGRMLWHFADPVHIDTAPATTGDAVVIGSGVSRRGSALPGLFALAPATGEKVWQVRTDLPAWGGPVVAGGVMVCGLGHYKHAPDQSNGGAVIALGTGSGRELWRTPTPAAVVAPPAIDGQRVYAADLRGNVAALDLATGRIVWHHARNETVIAGLTLTGETLLVADKAGRVVGLDTTTGDLLWEFDVARRAQLPAVVTAMPVAADDGTGRFIMYLGCEIVMEEGKAAVVYAVRLP